MAVAETKVRILLQDAMTGPLRNIRGDLIKTNTAASQLSKTFKSYAGIGASLAAGATGIYSLYDKVGEVFGKAATFNQSMETNTIGMAGILTSMTQINGQQLEWNDAMKMSSVIIERLNNDALKTSATTEELVTTFRALLGPGLGAGMNIEQIQKFTTVGVNAVKSLGLEGRQLVQELRDLVQGGIQPASSTLATALGLKDKDIKEAKNSAEGLYSFLMKRIAGFEQAALATPKTLAGLRAQIDEGLTRGIASGIQPVLNEYKRVLLDVKNELITLNSDGEYGLNNKFADSIREASNHVVNLYRGLEKVGSYIGPGLNTAVNAFGDGLSFAADNVDKIAAGFALWKLNSIVNDLTTVKGSIETVTASQGILNGAVQNYRNFWMKAKDAGSITAREHILAAENAAASIIQANNKRVQSEKQTQFVWSTAEKLYEKGYQDLADKITMLETKYIDLGVDAQAAAKMQYQAAKQAARGNYELAESIMVVQEKEVQAALAAAKRAEEEQNKRNKLMGVANALSAVGLLTTTLADDENELAKSFGNAAFEAGILVQTALALSDALKAVKLSSLGVFGMAAAAVGGVAYGAYEKYKAWQNGAEFEYDENGVVTIKEKPSGAGDLKALERQQEEALKIAELQKQAEEKMKQLEAKFPKAIDTSAADKKAKAQENTIKKAKYRYEKAIGEVNELSASLDRKIVEGTGDAYSVSLAKINEEVAKMNTTLNKAAANGIGEDVLGNVREKITEYEELQKRLANNDAIYKAHEQRMSLIRAWEDANIVTTQRANELREEELTSYQDHLNEILNSQQLNADQRLEVMQKLAQAYIDLNDATSSSMKNAWDNALTYIQNKVYDQRATIRAGIDEMLGEFTNFGQNMLTESKSLSERFDNLFKNLANSIMNTMIKVIMQGLVMRSIMGLFGGGSVNFGASPGNAGMGTGLSSINDVGLGIQFANGGYATGWSIVGERGPELVNFSQPGRVYNAEQTAKALGNGAPTDVKVVIENRSGQQVQATNATAKFDGKSMILGVVIDAVRTNDGGFANILKGAVANG